MKRKPQAKPVKAWFVCMPNGEPIVEDGFSERAAARRTAASYNDYDLGRYTVRRGTITLDPVKGKK